MAEPLYKRLQPAVATGGYDIGATVETYTSAPTTETPTGVAGLLERVYDWVEHIADSIEVPSFDVLYHGSRQTSKKQNKAQKRLGKKWKQKGGKKKKNQK